MSVGMLFTRPIPYPPRLLRAGKAFLVPKLMVTRLWNGNAEMDVLAVAILRVVLLMDKSLLTTVKRKAAINRGCTEYIALCFVYERKTGERGSVGGSSAAECGVLSVLEVKWGSLLLETLNKLKWLTQRLPPNHQFPALTLCFS